MELNDLLGLPFAPGGRGEVGYDCWGLVIEIYRRLGIQVEDPGKFYDVEERVQEDPFNSERDNAFWEEVKPPYKEYDVILFTDGVHNVALHAGVYMGDGKVLQSLHGRGVVALPLRLLKERVYGAYRCRALG